MQKANFGKCWFLILVGILSVIPSVATAQESQSVPEPLREWKNWATWGEVPPTVPAPYDDAAQKIAAWPSSLKIDAHEKGGSFSYRVRVYHPTWISLPGDSEVWPLGLMAGELKLPILARDQKPCVYLGIGDWQLTGNFQWPEMPQQLFVPQDIGIFELVLNGNPIELPNWDESGTLWLQRSNSEEADKNSLTAKVYRLLRDGSPMWLDTEIELTVTGKSREEVLGNCLPDGWQISGISSIIPCKIDTQGLLNAQVRSGKWTIAITAFRTTPLEKFTYAESAKPLVAEELIALNNNPAFRLIEFTNIPVIDVTQTSFPDAWRNFPLHLWDTKSPFQIVEKMRGMGEKKPPGLAMARQFWLDEDGKKFTYKDSIKGSLLQTWRLDVAKGQMLGAAKIHEQSQLITRNPLTQAEGIEVRERSLDLQAVGRMENQSSIPATGWQADAESLNANLFLPPGWRLLAIWGADWSHGDWLTAWTLLDVFFLLMVTITLGRIWGWKIGAIAFLAYVFTCQETGAPRFSWLLLIGMLVAQHFVPVGKLKKSFQILTVVAACLLLALLTPFLVKQIQQAIYPQLAKDFMIASSQIAPAVEMAAPTTPSESFRARAEQDPYGGILNIKKMANYSSDAKIQTGPAVPEWTGSTSAFGWSGPVSAKETISFVLVPLWLERIFTVIRVGLLLGLLYLLLRTVKFPPTNKQSSAAAARASMICIGISLIFLSAPQASAQYPSPEMLAQLRERILETPNDLEQRAQIPQVRLSLTGRALTMEAEIHCARETAVPIPGRLPTWSPLTVQANGQNDLPTIRKDGYLWVVLPAGIHQITVKGLVPSSDWQWSFLLKPQYVSIEAPDWTYTGVKQNGSPEAQVFFVEKAPSNRTETSYERNDFQPLLQVQRSLELGLTWSVHTEVRRLSPKGKAISLSLPLVPGERVLSSGFNVENNRIEVRLGAQEEVLAWESELGITERIELKAEKNDRWAEFWKVSVSPTWNLVLTGLPPVFEMNENRLVPTWQPWPTETIALQISRPEATIGETMTIHRAKHSMSLGQRQRTSELSLDVLTSLGSEFAIEIDPAAEITSLMLQSVETPVRRDGSRLLIPLQPGEQNIQLAWKLSSPLPTHAHADRVKLPIPSANTQSSIRLSANDRWIIWTNGPLNGPAVRFWVILISAMLFGLILGMLPLSPLKSYEWILLIVGLTQAPWLCGFFVIGWLYLISLRGRFGHSMPEALFNLGQVLLILSVLPLLLILLYILHEGLLGRPEMWITGMGSTASELNWYQARSESRQLPDPSVISVSIWFYRGLMLVWAIWLAFAILRWSRWSWSQLASGGFWKSSPKEKSPV